jgi:hypothetical protein
MRRSIPSRDVINKLDDSNGLTASDQLWILDIMTDIHSGFCRSGGRYCQIKKQKDWREAYTCVVQEMKGDIVSQVYPTVESFLGSRGWNSEIEIGGLEFNSHTFAHLPRYYSLSCCT